MREPPTRGRRTFLKQAAALVGATRSFGSVVLAGDGPPIGQRGDAAAGTAIRMRSTLPGSSEIWILASPGAGFQETWACRELARGLRQLGVARDPVPAAPASGQPPPDAFVFTLGVQADASRHVEVSEVAQEPAAGKGTRIRITGASPQALLYAVFGFLERQGAFFGLDGEVFPLDAAARLVLPPPGKPWIDRPRFAVRGLVPWPDFLNCITVFNREDYRAYLEAMVRMRFNTLGIHVYSGLNQWAESFLSFEYGGVGHLAFTDTTGTHRWGYLPERTSRFGMGSADLYDADVFGPEATTMARSTWEAQERAQALWGEAFRYAQQLGIRTGVGFEPYMVPDEIFRAAPPEARSRTSDPKIPQPRIDPESVAARDILEARLGRLLEAYPTVDYVWLWEDEGMSWASQQARVPLSVTAFLQAHEFLRRHAPNKRLVVSGWGGVSRHFPDFHQRLPGDVIFSSLSDSLGWDPVSEEYGRLERRERWPVLWIEDDPAMWLPQFHVHRSAADIDRAESFGCQGLLGIHWRHRIVDATAGFQARASWDRELTPAAFFDAYARASVRPGREELLARVLTETDRDRRILCTATGEVKGGHQQTHEYSGDYDEAFQFWNGYEPSDDVKASQAEVARALAGLAAGASSPAERERLEYLAKHVAFLVPYAESWSLAWRLHQLLQKALDLKRNGDGSSARALVARDGVPLWLKLAPLVREAILSFQSIVATRNDLGTLASMHNKYERLALVRLRASMKELLGDLPTETEILFDGVRRRDPTIAPRVFVPTRPTALGKGERVRVMAVVAGGERVTRMSLVTRLGQAAPWVAAAMKLRGRRTYEAELAAANAIRPFLDYYVRAEVVRSDGSTGVCTAPLEAPARHYTVTLLPNARVSPARPTGEA
jgi:hypothetical protein